MTKMSVSSARRWTFRSSVGVGEAMDLQIERWRDRHDAHRSVDGDGRLARVDRSYVGPIATVALARERARESERPPPSRLLSPSHSSSGTMARGNAVRTLSVSCFVQELHRFPIGARDGDSEQGGSGQTEIKAAG